jgi:pyruvate kinase
MAHTKIVATLGPATDRPGVLHELVEAGVDVFRLNASHSTQEQLQRRIHEIRAALAKEDRKHTAILVDLQGPKIRLGKFEGGGAELQTGAEFTITTEPVTGTAERASTSYADFARDVRPGNRILLADGSIELRAVASDGVSVRTEVVSGGRISDRKGINLPGVRVSSSSLTDKDAADLDFAIREGVDLIAISFVRTAADVVQVRHRMRGKGLPIIAKIEKPEAWENIDAILQAADGAMVARGDLGVEMALEKVPRIQKSIIRRARRLGRFVITATQMLESMTENPTPTRAEVSDVANAIYDGTDAVMLSAETAMGKYPAESVRVMERIAVETENAIRARGFQDPVRGAALTIAEILADSAFRAARDADAAAIVVFTASGSSARLIARYRPPVPIYAMTQRDTVARQLAVAYGVTPVLAPEVESTDQMLEQMDRLLLESGYVKFGQPVVFVAGQPIGRPGTTNLMKIHRIGH